MLIDSHCHLDFYETDKIIELLATAKLAGVNYMLNAGSSKSSFEQIIKLVNTYSNIFGAIGQHPHDVEECGLVSKEELLQYIKSSNKVIAIGETGLDYSRGDLNKVLQITGFLNHIELAQTTKLPLIIHSRDASDDMIKILTDEMSKKPFKAILHCFTGDFDFAQKLIELGIYISASGIITFNNAKELQNTFASLPLDKLLIETDSPYLAPTPFRGKENQPAYVSEVAKKLAELKSVSREDIANITTQNFENLFNLKLDD